ncbi:MAG: AAA family ATPase [Armatimonadota bacterium]
MADIRFRRLRLEGFGRFAQPVEFLFHEGINVYIAPNESGKSTLVAGIEAVLFGLEQSKDPKKFSVHRFRSWCPHDRFAGELELEWDGRGWRFHRAFHENKLNISVLTDAGVWQPQREYTHNPRARKKVPAVHDVLEKLLAGITDRSLFERTFCLPQVLPDSSTLEVQQLLSGGDAYNKALKKDIVERAKQVTRYTGRMGLTPRDAYNEGKVEQWEREIETKRRSLEQSKRLVDELHEKQQKRERLENEHNELKEEVAQLEKQINACQQWLQCYEKYAQTFKEQTEIRQKLGMAQQVQSLIKQREGEKSRYPNWCRQDSDPKDVVSKARNRTKELLGNWNQLKENRQKYEQIAMQIQDKYSVFEQAPPEDIQLLERYEAEKERIDKELLQAKHHLENLQKGLSDYDAAKGQYEQTFGDIEQIPTDAVRKKIELLRAYAAPPSIARSRAALVFASGGVVSLALGVLLGGVAVGMVLAVLCAGIAVILYYRGRQQAQAMHSQQLREVNEQLGSLAEKDDITELAALHERLKQRDTEKSRLQELARNLPTEESLQEAEEKVRQWETEQRRFSEKIKPYEEAFGDSLTEEYKNYERLVNDRKRIEEALHKDAEPFGVSWSEVDRQPCARYLEDFGMLAEEMGLSNPEAPLSDLMQKLAALSEEFWKQREQKASDYNRLCQDIEKQRAELKGILQDKTIEDLQREETHRHNEASSLLSKWKQLVEDHPYLPPAQIDEGQERSVRERLYQLQEDLKEKKRRQEERQQQFQDIAQEIGQLEGKGVHNIAKLQEEIEQLEREKEQLQFEAEALTVAYLTLEQAAEEFHQDCRQQLAEAITEYFQRFAPAENPRRVDLKENFELQVYESERQIDLSQLSRGAQDQLYLAVRFALADYLSDNVRMPFIFDDSFVHCDAERREAIRSVLEQVAPHRQIIILSHDPAFEAWGRPLQVMRTETHDH